MQPSPGPSPHIALSRPSALPSKQQGILNLGNLRLGADRLLAHAEESMGLGVRRDSSRPGSVMSWL